MHTDRGSDAPLRIGVVGEFNAGKSSLINWLLGKDMMPVDIFQTTATINVARHGVEPGLVLVYADGRREQRPTSDLGDFTADKGEFADIEKLEMVSPELPPGIELIDTPGFNDPNVYREELVGKILPTCDIIFFVCDSTQPLKASEEPYLRKTFGRFLFSHTLFILNQVDLLNTTARAQQVRRHVLQQLQAILAEIAGVESALSGEPRRLALRPGQVLFSCALREAFDKMPPDLASLVGGDMSAIRQHLERVGREARSIRARQQCEETRTVLSALRSQLASIEARRRGLLDGHVRHAKAARLQVVALEEYERSCSDLKRTLPTILDQVGDRSLEQLRGRLDNPALLLNPYLLEQEMRQRLSVTCEELVRVHRGHLKRVLAGATDQEAQPHLGPLGEDLDLSAAGAFAQHQEAGSAEREKANLVAGLAAVVAVLALGPILGPMGPVLGKVLTIALPLMTVVAHQDQGQACRQRAVQELTNQARSVFLRVREELLRDLDRVLERVEASLVNSSKRVLWSLVAEAMAGKDLEADEAELRRQVADAQARLKLLSLASASGDPESGV